MQLFKPFLVPERYLVKNINRKMIKNYYKLLFVPTKQ